MSPAEELRAAATLLRETASKATPGPWTVHTIAGIGRTVNDPEGSLSIPVGTSWVSADDGAWIALMSPAVAEPLAAVLDDQAATYEVWLSRENHDVAERIVLRALVLARSILGRTA